MGFVCPLPIVVLLFAQTVSSIGFAQPVDKYWQGKLVHKKQTWDIGISIESDSKAKFYSETLLRSGVQAEGFSRIGDSITFEIPFTLGKFQGKLHDGKIVGTVTLANKAEERLELTPTTLTDVRKEEILFENGEVNIAATLALPEEKGRYPLVVVLHGGGDSSRESPPYAFFAEYLPKHGIACLIYDKRGNGKSTGNWKTVGFDKRAEDLVIALHHLKQHKEINPNKMGLIGISQGSWVAGIVADKSSNVAYVVNVVGSLMTPLDADTYAQKYHFRKLGWPSKDIKEYLHLWDLDTKYIRTPQTDSEWTKLQDAIANVKERDWFSASPYEPDKNSWFTDWYKEMMDHDPMPVLRRSKIPMLWIYGNRDSQSDFARNMALLSELKRSGKQFDVEVISDVGHGLLGPVDEDGNESILLATPDYYLRSMVSWLLAR